MDNTQILKQRAADLEKVVTYSIMSTLRKSYASVEEYRKFYNKVKDCIATSKEQIDLCIQLKGLKQAEYRKILGQIEEDGKKRYVTLKDVQPYFNSWFHHQAHFNKNYKSGKTYAVHSYWYIDFNVLKRWWNFEDVYDLNSSFYTRLQHTYIDALVFKGRHMTQKQKQQYEKEYSEGKHALTLEQYLKDQAKKQRTADKHRMTIARKAARSTLTEAAKAFAENEMLKAEVSRLEACKDKNSDIEAEKDQQIALLKQKLDKAKIVIQKLQEKLKASKENVQAENAQQQTKQIKATTANVQQEAQTSNSDIVDVDIKKLRRGLIKKTQQMLDSMAIDHKMATKISCAFKLSHSFSDAVHGVSSTDLQENIVKRHKFFQDLYVVAAQVIDLCSQEGINWLYSKMCEMEREIQRRKAKAE